MHLRQRLVRLSVYGIVHWTYRRRSLSRAVYRLLVSPISIETRAKKLLLRPVVGPLVAKYLGTVVKKRREGRPVDSLNVASYPTAFYLTCLPVHTLRQMWLMQVKLWALAV